MKIRVKDQSKNSKISVKKVQGHKMTRDEKKGTIKQHKNEIKRLKTQIHKHRLLIKQARLEYKISKK